ncbi:GntR family transcriptional regulator [Streptomyces griseorubiginosus]|uniref:GntR family transcriptional regulator n=1 Tax=Streptomyces griseorubiginosus TaxID=67304 RepID=UPI001AD615BC|nr:GntR family transcriptional regulator [Streptomyces griseorubiginosus]MBO4252324.1 FCD domain-containing protein [Streptomyces griseorubiginosus]
MAEGKSASNKARPMSEKAYETLREGIVRCELAPGTWIKASELSEQLGLGRTPTIQALQRLEAAGFTRPVKRKGWQVTPVTLQHVHDILETFELTAPGLVTLVTRNATDEQIAALRELVTSWAPGRPASEARPDFRANPFRYLVQICHNPVMTELAMPLAAHVERILNFGLRQHEPLDTAYVRWRDAAFEAMVARDGVRAGEAILELIRLGSTEIYRILRESQAIRSVPLQIERAS